MGVIVQEIVGRQFVMFALPVALDAEVLQDPGDLLEIDVVWDVHFDYLGGCQIKIGEAELSATGEKANDLFRIVVSNCSKGHTWRLAPAEIRLDMPFNPALWRAMLLSKDVRCSSRCHDACKCRE